MCAIQLALAHFCETHGPVSIICTQAAPVTCSYCAPTSTTSSFRELRVAHKDVDAHDTVILSATGSFDFSDVHEPLDKDDSENSTWQGGGNALRPVSDSREEQRRLYEAGCETKYCVSCSIFAPQDLAQSLPAGCPGSLIGAAGGRNGSPILRSEEPLTVWDDETQSDSDNEEDTSITDRKYHPPSGSYSSRASSSFHTHTLNYISTSNPINPNIYSLFRKLVLRTLTGEELPRGLTSGKMAFDDTAERTTIAYKFRLSDPFARGGYRFYAFIALANSDNWAAFQAAPRIWDRFQVIADWLAGKVEENNAINQPPTSAMSSDRGDTLDYLPVPSFLTGRDRPRARGLTEMTGDEKIFAALHLEFVSLRKELRNLYE